MDQRQPTSPVEQVERLFAKRLRELRSELGLSQAALAEKLTAAGVKIDDLAILRIEKWDEGSPGARRVRLGEAVAIAKALESDLHDMLRPDIPLNVQLRYAREKLARCERDATEAWDNLAHAGEQVAKLKEALRREEEEAILRVDLSAAEMRARVAHQDLDQIASQLASSKENEARVAAEEGEDSEGFRAAKEQTMKIMNMCKQARAAAEEGDNRVQIIMRRQAQVGLS